MAINNFNVGVGTTSQLTRYRYVATGGETSISGTDADGKTLSYTVGLEQVFLNGVNLVRGQDYTATNGTTISNLTALVASDSLEVFAYVPFNIANAVTASTVDAKGDLLVGTGADTVGRLAVGTNGQMLVADSAATTGLKWASAGKIIQVVQTVKTDTFTTSSASFVDVTGMSASITPVSASNKIFVLTNIRGSNDLNVSLYLKLLRGATDIYIGDAAGTRERVSGVIFGDVASLDAQDINFLDSPNTTSSVTYKIQARVNTAGSGYINRRSSDGDGPTTPRGASSITLLEVSI